MQRPVTIWSEGTRRRLPDSSANGNRQREDPLAPELQETDPFQVGTLPFSGTDAGEPNSLFIGIELTGSHRVDEPSIRAGTDGTAVIEGTPPASSGTESAASELGLDPTLEPGRVLPTAGSAEGLQTSSPTPPGRAPPAPQLIDLDGGLDLTDEVRRPGDRSDVIQGMLASSSDSGIGLTIAPDTTLWRPAREIDVEGRPLQHGALHGPGR